MDEIFDLYLAGVRGTDDDPLMGMLFETDDGVLAHTPNGGLTYFEITRLSGETDQQAMTRIRAIEEAYMADDLRTFTPTEDALELLKDGTGSVVVAKAGLPVPWVRAVMLGLVDGEGKPTVKGKVGHPEAIKAAAADAIGLIETHRAERAKE